MVFAKNSMRIALGVALFSCIVQGISGDRSGKVIAKYQPSKLAAFEALYKTQSGVGLTVFGIPNAKEERLDYAIQIPKLLSYLSFEDGEAEIKGLDQIPKKDWPNVPMLFWSFRAMIGLWIVMLFLSILGVYMWRKGTLFTNKWILRVFVLSAVFPQLANQLGWLSAESGRYPWIVYGHLRISEGLSKAVTANQILGSIIMFGILYTFLFFLFVYLMNEKIKHGPENMEDASTPYHQLPHLIGEKSHDHEL